MLLNKREIEFLEFLICEEIGFNKFLIYDRENGIQINPDEVLDEIKECQEKIKVLEVIDNKLKVEKERINRLQTS